MIDLLSTKLIESLLMNQQTDPGKVTLASANEKASGLQTIPGSIIRSFVAFLILISCGVLVAEDSTVSGIIVNERGTPVPNAELSSFWRANGSPCRPDGTDYDLSDPKQASQFWGNVGQMAVWQPGKRTARDGKFMFETTEKKHFLVLDVDRKNGAVHRVGAERPRDEIELQLGPLSTVKAQVRIKSSSDHPIWSHVYVHLPSNPDFPLASTRLISCGSETGDLEVRLPKGKYRLEVYAVSGEQPDDVDLRLYPDKMVVVKGNGETIDLGLLRLDADAPDRQDLEQQAKESGRWRDYTKHYGEPSPRWNAIDSRGLSPGSNIDDLRGKWVLLEFWGLSCVPCLSAHMPEAMEFYESHAEFRSEFEVIGVCIDFTGKLKSMRDLDSSLKPIVEKVWDGKEIPFPVVLDNSFATWERFGIPGLGTAVLVDPSGNVVAGGLKELARVLEKAKRQN